MEIKGERKREGKREGGIEDRINTLMQRGIHK